jgi:hypothetical protein
MCCVINGWLTLQFQTMIYDLNWGSDFRSKACCLIQRLCFHFEYFVHFIIPHALCDTWMTVSLHEYLISQALLHISHVR